MSLDDLNDDELDAERYMAIRNYTETGDDEDWRWLKHVSAERTRRRELSVTRTCLSCRYGDHRNCPSESIEKEYEFDCSCYSRGHKEA